MKSKVYWAFPLSLLHFATSLGRSTTLYKLLSRSITNLCIGIFNTYICILLILLVWTIRSYHKIIKLWRFCMFRLNILISILILYPATWENSLLIGFLYTYSWICHVVDYLQIMAILPVLISVFNSHFLC